MRRQTMDGMQWKCLTLIDKYSAHTNAMQCIRVSHDRVAIAHSNCILLCPAIIIMNNNIIVCAIKMCAYEWEDDDDDANNGSGGEVEKKSHTIDGGERTLRHISRARLVYFTYVCIVVSSLFLVSTLSDSSIAQRMRVHVMHCFSVCLFVVLFIRNSIWSRQKLSANCVLYQRSDECMSLSFRYSAVCSFLYAACRMRE